MILRKGPERNQTLTSHVRDSYGRRASEYVQVLGSIGQMADNDRETIAKWASHISDPILDAGSGPGHWTHYLHEQGSDIEGIDLTPEFVESAQARFPEVKFQTGSFESLPFEAGSFGGVLSWYSLIHVDPGDVPKILAEFSRVLKSEGLLLLGFFEGQHLEAFDHAVAQAYFWPIAEMESCLNSVGFDVVRSDSRHDLPNRPHAEIAAKKR